MTDFSEGEVVFRDDLYRQTFATIRTLRSRLPQEALVPLAREVIRRLNEDYFVDDNEIDSPAPEVIRDLCRALTTPTSSAGIEFIDRVRAEGASLETVHLAYLRPAALLLGEWWEDDRISFVDVTLGTGHIFSIMRGLSEVISARNPVSPKQAALFTVVPGETHLLGVRMAADLFRHEGWDITLSTDLDHDSLVEFVVKDHHAVVGVSAAGEHSLPELARLIVALRMSAPRTLIFVGGNIVEVAKDMVALLGPDGMAGDYQMAQSEMKRLCSGVSV